MMAGQTEEPGVIEESGAGVVKESRAIEESGAGVVKESRAIEESGAGVVKEPGVMKESAVVEVLCPTVAELELEPQLNVPCTVDGCDKIFTTSSARKVHIIKTHEIYKDERERQQFTRSRDMSMPKTKVTKHFYCPVQGCNRSRDSNNGDKPFSRLSLLKQHYHMMHAVKRFACPKCEKRFSTQRQCTTHERDCGRTFKCTCGETYKAMTALYMHAKRNSHELPEEFKSKRRKQKPVVKEPGYILVVPVPFDNSQDMTEAIKKPFPLLPRTSAYCIPMSAETSDSKGGDVCKQKAFTVNVPGVVYPGCGQGGPVIGKVKANQCLSTSSTQTVESEIGSSKLQLKQTQMATAYAQTAHSCFPGFIPMVNGPRTFKRHKKTSAIQTNINWPQEQRQAAQLMSTSETQTLNSGVPVPSTVNVAQTQTILDLQSAILPNEVSRLENPHLGETGGQFLGPGAMLNNSHNDSGLSSTKYNHGLNSAYVQTSPYKRQRIHLDISTDTPRHQEIDIMNTPGATSVSTSSAEANASMGPLNEVLIQTDLTFQNFLEYHTSETQTFANVSDAMTDMSETPTESAGGTSTAIPMGETESVGTANQEVGDLVTHAATGMEMTSLGEAVSVSTGAGQDGSDLPGTSLAPPAAQVMEMTGLDLLFLASTEHRSQVASLDMPRLEDTFCTQQTQTSMAETDTGHQETQTAWDWSLDEFSFLDQYTQTVLSASSANASTNGSNDAPSSSVAETDQLCQTGLSLLPAAFSFSNTETQTMSMFDLEMFGNSISVQTESSARSATGPGLLGEDSLSSVSTQVQMAQQEMVCADAQTDAMDFDRIRSRQMGSGQLATSQTQTSFWEDIESIIRSDNFTQTQFP